MRDRRRDVRASLALALGSCLSALLSVALAAPSSSASAQTDAVELVLTPVAARGLDVERVRIGLAEELDGEVRVRSTAHRRAGVRTIIVRSGARGRLSVELSRGDGTRMSRDTVVPMDPDERAATIVIVAANMLRDEASELLAMLRGRGGEEDAAASETASVMESAPATETAPATESASVTPTESATQTASAVEIADRPETVLASEIASASEVATAIPSRSVSASDASPASPAAPHAAPDEARRPAFLRLGLGAQLGSVPRAHGAPDPTLVSGFEIAWTPEPFFAIGVRDLSGGVIGATDRVHYGGSPFVELAWTLLPELALHGQIGVQVQGLTGGRNAAAAGVAPFLLLGARFQIIPELSIGIETAARMVASDGLLTQLHALPQGAVLWTGGLSILFHIS